MTQQNSEQMKIFDRATVRLHRDRAACVLDQHGFLFAEVADRLAERVDDVLRDFPTVLDLGCHGGDLAQILPGRKGIETVISADLSLPMVEQAQSRARQTLGLVCDEEFLPIAPGAVDLVTSALSLHWVNDLPGALLQIRQALKPDGFFLAALFGGETLKELRDSLTVAESEVCGGLSPRVSPFVDVRDAGALLSRAGFTMPVVDSEIITVTYDHPLKLMGDLRGMGESNAVAERIKHFTRRELLVASMEHYLETYADDDGRIPATFQIVWLAGWAPHESQPQPKAPGSATVSFIDALGGSAPDLQD
jgi:SAM-dependent methyltransferase